MSEAMRIYKENVGNTHEAAIEEVWKAAFQAGVDSTVENVVIPAVQKK